MVIIFSMFGKSAFLHSLGRSRKFNLHPLPIAWIAGSVSDARALFNSGRQDYKTSVIISNAIIAAIPFITRSPIMSIAHLPL